MILFFAFVFGAMIGSFLNVLIYRLPKEISPIMPRSFCIHCKKMIRWYQNIPLLSFLMLRGKCANCGKKIHIRYFLVELFSGILAIFLFRTVFDKSSLITFLINYSAISTFLVIALIDLKYYIIPDGLNIFLFVIFLINAIFTQKISFYILGSIIGLAFPLGVAYLFYLITKKEGMGGGDIKLYAALGVHLGPLGIVTNIFLSCLIGTIVGLIYLKLNHKNKETPIPFGPFIVIAATIQLFYPDIFNKLFLF